MLGIMLKLKTRPNSNRKKKQNKKPASWTDSEVVLVWELGPLGSGTGPDPHFLWTLGKSIPFSGLLLCTK